MSRVTMPMRSSHVTRDMEAPVTDGCVYDVGEGKISLVLYGAAVVENNRSGGTDLVEGHINAGVLRDDADRHC
jgi:hypothetical protein